MTTIPDSAARIARITLHPVLHVMGDAGAYGMARGLVSARGATIVEIETNTGVSGFGEAWGPPGFCAAYLDFVAADWRGARLVDHGALFHRVLARNYHFGVQNGLMALLSGLDMAVHDALGKEHGLPVHALIGGRARDGVPVYGSGGYFTADPALGLASQLPRFRDFAACKIKIGRGVADDVARVRLAPRVIDIAQPDLALCGGLSQGRLIGQLCTLRRGRQRQLRAGPGAGQHARHRALRHRLVRGAAEPGG
jgi:D-galactarolactone cycloisomerase